jgi:diaminopimelate decarboxylase
MTTPYFLIHEEELLKNIREFQNTLLEIWPNSQLAYSVKTNSLPWILKYMKQEQVFAEVVSEEEYKLAKLCGFPGREIIFNGPIKNKEALKQALEEGAYINLDSKNELEYFQKNGLTGKETIGLRINVDPQLFCEEDIEYIADGFRFGYSEETGDFEQTLNCIRAIKPDVRIGLHLHCNSITRSLNVYSVIAKYAAFIIKKYKIIPSYIDVGGGFFGGIEGKPTAKDYIWEIRKNLETVVDIQQTKLILEPGSALIGSVVDLITSVLDVKDTTKARIVTTDGSRIHIDPLWIKKDYCYSLITDSKNKIKEQIVCGYTCMDHDRIMKISEKPELKVGNKIVYHRIGAYSMTLGGMFIKYYPEVYVERSGSMDLVRRKISTEEYLIIQSV